MARGNPLGLEEPIISPTEFVAPLEDCPAVAVTTYSQEIIDAYVSERNLSPVAWLHSSGGDIPVYRCDVGGHPFLLYRSLIGAPSAVSGMEEVSAMGCDTFVTFGSCGVIDSRSVLNATVIAPCGAYADEGTSAHYGRDESDRIVNLGAESFVRVAEVANSLHVPHLTALVWTTDAFYRETQTDIDARLRNGCVAVEMEVSAMAQAAKALGLRLYAFLYVADDLSGEGYDQGSLGEHGMGGWLSHMRLAEEIVRSHYEVTDELLMTPMMLRK